MSARLADRVELCRLPGWEARLAAHLEAARGKPYKLGEHDCFRFACGAVQALAGVDLWEAWRGRYSSKRSALRLLAEYGGGFTGAFTRLFGVEPSDCALARRGDVVEYRDAEGVQHLGVVAGAMVAVMLERDLSYVWRRDCAHAWRIG